MLCTSQWVGNRTRGATNGTVVNQVGSSRWWWQWWYIPTKTAKRPSLHAFRAHVVGTWRRQRIERNAFATDKADHLAHNKKNDIKQKEFGPFEKKHSRTELNLTGARFELEKFKYLAYNLKQQPRSNKIRNFESALPEQPEENFQMQKRKCTIYRDPTNQIDRSNYVASKSLELKSHSSCPEKRTRTSPVDDTSQSLAPIYPSSRLDSKELYGEIRPASTQLNLLPQLATKAIKILAAYFTRVCGFSKRRCFSNIVAIRIWDSTKNS